MEWSFEESRLLEDVKISMLMASSINGKSHPCMQVTFKTRREVAFE